jgi:hypothetical protein
LKIARSPPTVAADKMTVIRAYRAMRAGLKRSEPTMAALRSSATATV